jgi:photoactive yellow protein
MEQAPTPGFDDDGLLDWLCTADDAALDTLPFGVIGFGPDGAAVVQRYNRTEREGSGLTVGQVLHRPLFTEVAQCMNNYLVAQRFEDAQADAQPLDETLPYVFTLRMRPSPVVLRLLAAPDRPLRFVVVQRSR